MKSRLLGRHPGTNQRNLITLTLVVWQGSLFPLDVIHNYTHKV